MSKRVALHALGGGALGYLVLHPASMLIHIVSGQAGHSWWHFLPMSFSMAHLTMAAYFAVLGAIFGAVHGLYAQKLNILCARMRKLSLTDPVTSLHNRQHFLEKLDEATAQAGRNAQRFSIVLAKIDHFKNYNDRQGHQKADTLLRSLALLLKELVADESRVARYEGSEFAVLVPEGKDAARKLAEKLRIRTGGCTFPGQKEQPGGKVTLSAGVAEFPDDGDTSDKLVRAAERSLLKAKLDGRNLVR